VSGAAADPDREKSAIGSTCGLHQTGGQILHKPWHQILGTCAVAKTDAAAEVAEDTARREKLPEGSAHIFSLQLPWLWGLGEKVDRLHPHPDGSVDLRA